MATKQCVSCSLVLNTAQYYVYSSGRIYGSCRSCVGIKNRAKATPEARSKKKLYDLKYRIENQEKIVTYKKLWMQANKESLTAKKRARRQEIAKIRNAYNKRRKSSDPIFKLTCNLRTRISSLVSKSKGSKKGSTLELLGCSAEEFKNYLEARFYERSTGEKMSWNNYGRDGWHLDHIRPLSSFDLLRPGDVAVACHFNNLQPLWQEDNLAKGERVT